MKFSPSKLRLWSLALLLFFWFQAAAQETNGTSPIDLPAALPAAMPNTVTVTDWVPGRMHLRLAQPAAASAYVIVSENLDRPWRAFVDGRETRVLRGDATLITVPVTAGAREIYLRYESTAFERGRLISIICLLVALGVVVIPVALRLRVRTPAVAMLPSDSSTT